MAKIEKFAEDRDWHQFHTPRNLVLSILAELGELAEVFQWRTDTEINNGIELEKIRGKYEEEIADVAIYLLRLCQVLDVDLLEVMDKKIHVNEAKYPISESRGNARKYSDR